MVDIVVGVSVNQKRTLVNRRNFGCLRQLPPLYVNVKVLCFFFSTRLPRRFNRNKCDMTRTIMAVIM